MEPMLEINFPSKLDQPMTRKPSTIKCQKILSYTIHKYRTIHKQRLQSKQISTSDYGDQQKI